MHHYIILSLLVLIPIVIYFLNRANYREGFQMGTNSPVKNDTYVGLPNTPMYPSSAPQAQAEICETCNDRVQFCQMSDGSQGQCTLFGMCQRISF
jgi:hypothetical protein